MLATHLLICVVLTFVTAQSSPKVTFQNVEIHGYSMYTHKFKLKVESAKTLKEVLPTDKIFDKIEIINSNIPVLYKDSISDIDLDELILTNDKITAIQPGTFKNVPLLRKLVITKNKIDDIQEGVFNNLNIATLDLSGNSISSVATGAFDDMPEILNINLADNLLAVWNKDWFAHTPLLTRVSLQNNLFEEIPAKAFQNFKGEKQFGSVSLTINIILSHNKIKKIEKTAFDQLSKIHNLWLDNNQIAEWDPELLSNVAVKDLRLDHNKLGCLSGDLSKIFIAQTTHIDGNPWDCGCLKNIELWATEHKKDVIMFYSKMTCDAERIDRRIKELNACLKELRDVEEIDDRR